MELRDARFADEQALRALVAAAGLPVADLRVAPGLWVVAARAGSCAGWAGGRWGGPRQARRAGR